MVINSQRGKLCTLFLWLLTVIAAKHEPFYYYYNKQKKNKKKIKKTW
jgi:hypothetical protein